jgi:hypothetical protein
VRALLPLGLVALLSVCFGAFVLPRAAPTELPQPAASDRTSVALASASSSWCPRHAEETRRATVQLYRLS